MKSKEQLAEDYTNSDYFRLEYSTFGTTAKECQKAFLAGFQARDEQLKEFVGRMKELSQAMPPNAVSMEIYRALQKIRMRE